MSKTIYYLWYIIILIYVKYMCVCMWKVNEKYGRWESAKVLFEEPSVVYTVVWNIQLLFSNYLLSSAKIAIHSRLHIWQILLALLMLLLVWWRMLHSISGLVPYLKLYINASTFDVYYHTYEKKMFSKN